MERDRRDIILMNPEAAIGTFDVEDLQADIQKAFDEFAKAVRVPMRKALAVIGDENLDLSEIQRHIDNDGVEVIIFVNEAGHRFAQCSPGFLQGLFDHPLVIGPSRHGKTYAMELMERHEVRAEAYRAKAGPDYLRHDPTKNHHRRPRRHPTKGHRK